MAHVSPRIPRKVILPFGYVITVKLLTNKEFNRKDTTSDGLWVVERRTIYIRNSLPLNRRRYILLHELGHAYTDLCHQVFDDGHAGPS